jgi:hypothetical protein
MDGTRRAIPLWVDIDITIVTATTTRSAKVLILSIRMLFRVENEGDNNASPQAMGNTLGWNVSLQAAVDVDFTLVLHEQKLLTLSHCQHPGPLLLDHRH